MSQANQSMASLGVLGRIMENDPEPRRRRRVVREERQMPVVSSREEGRALGLARGASMRRLSVWDNLPDSVDAPPPFVLRLAPIAQPDDPAPPFTDAPRSPPPTFEQATANLPASTDQPVSNTPSNLLTNPPIPATSSHLDMPRSRPTSILSIPSSPETHYASAPESPVETASEDEPDEREDRRAWNADISAGYSLLQRVEREAARRRVSREARSTPQGITEGLADEDGPVNVSATAPEVEATMEPVVAADETLISAEQHAQRNTVSAGPSDSAEITNAGTEGSELAVAIAAPPEPVSMLPSTQAPVTLPDTPLKPISSPTSLFPVLSATGAEDAGTLEALPEQSVIPADPVQSTEDDERGPGSVGLANRGQRKGTYDGVIANKEEEPVLSPAGASRAAAGSPKTLPLSKASKPEAPTKSRPTRVSEDISSSTANSPVASQPPVSSPSKAIPISPNAVLPSTLVALRSSKQSPQLHGPAAKEIKDESSRPSPQPAAKAITEFSASSAAPNAPIETPMLAPVAEEDGRSQVGSDIAITPTPTRKLTRGKAIRRSSSGLSISESRRAPESPRQPLFGELSDWRKAADLPEPRRQSSNVQSPPLASPTWGKSAESTPVLPPHREAALKRRELVTKSETPPRPEPLVDLFSSSDVPYHSPPPIISPELYQLFGEEPVAESSAQAAARIEQEQILATIQKTWGEPVKPKKPPPPPPPLRRTLVSTTVGANLTPRRSIIRTADSPVTPRPIRQLSQGSQDRPIVPTRRPPPPPPKPKELEAPTLPQRPAPTYTRRDSAFSESTSSDSQPVRPLRPRGPRPAPPNKRWGRIFLPEEKIPIRPLSERTQSDTVSQRPETARSMSEQNIRSPIEYTDLDVLVSRLEGSGREYEVSRQLIRLISGLFSDHRFPRSWKITCCCT